MKLKEKLPYVTAQFEELKNTRENDLRAYIEFVLAESTYKNLYVRIAWDFARATSVMKSVHDWMQEDDSINDSHLNTLILAALRESGIKGIIDEVEQASKNK